MDPSIELKLAALYSIFGSKRQAKGFLDDILTTDPEISDDELLRAAKEKAHQVAQLRRSTKNVTPTLPSRELLYVVRNLAFCGIPQEKPSERSVERLIRLPEGTLRITISSSRDDVPVVHGIHDRRVFAWICTEGIKGNSHRVWIHGDMKETLQKLGYDYDGSAYSMFYASLERWKRNKMELDWVDGPHVGKKPIEIGAGVGLLRSWRLPTKANREIPRDQNPGYFVDMSLDFFELLKEQPFPIPLDYLRPFNKNALGWDFAILVAARCAACHSESRIPLYSSNPEIVTVKKQLGSVDSNDYRFAEKLGKYLTKIKEYWQDLNAEIEGKYLVIRPSTYMVQHVKSQSVLSVFDREENKQPTLFTREALEAMTD